MRFSTFQGLSGRAAPFLGLQYLVSSQACAFICLQRTVVRLAWASWVVLGFVMFTCTARCRVIFLDICKQMSQGLPWKNGISQGKFGLGPLFYITQEQQNQ